MRITVSTDSQSQAQYLAFTARSIQLGLFQHDNYVVLPHLIHGHPQVVFFPDCQYSASFWQQLSQLPSYKLTDHFPPQLLAECLQHLISVRLHQVNVPQGWSETVTSCVQQLSATLGSQLTSHITELRVIPTTFGSCGSFSHHIDEKQQLLICTSRSDVSHSTLKNTLLKALIATTQTGYVDLGTPEYTHREAAVSIMTDSTQLLPALTPETSQKPLSYSQYNQSYAYLSRLSLNPQVQLNLEEFMKKLTVAEKKFFSALLSMPRQIVSLDTIGHALWSEHTDKFSLYAISDLGRSIRQKLQEFGVRREVLFTIRRQGYALIL